MQNGRRVVAIVLAVAGAGSARAQQRANIMVSGGMATDPRGEQVAAVSVAPGLTVSRARGTRVSIGAALVDYRNDAWALAGGISGEARRRTWEPLTVVLAGNVNAMHFGADSGSGNYASAEARPTLELAVQKLTLFAGLRGNAGLASPVSTQSALGTSVGAYFASSPSQGELMRLTARQEHFKVGSVSVNDVSAALVMTTRVGTFMGNIGHRDASDERGSFGDAGFAVHLTPNLQFNASAGRYRRDRFTGILGGNYVNVGFLFGPGMDLIPRSYLVPLSP